MPLKHLETATSELGLTGSRMLLSVHKMSPLILSMSFAIIDNMKYVPRRRGRGVAGTP